MNNQAIKTKTLFHGYLMLTFYYLGVLAMLFTITYPPFQEVHQNFRQHAIVLQRYLIWILYIPGILMLLSSVSLLVIRPAFVPKWAATASALLSFISVITLFIHTAPFHQQWITNGFDSMLFGQFKNSVLTLQIVPSVLQALIAIFFLHLYLGSVERITRILLITLFVLCFFPMGTIFVECHLNYALWAEVDGSEWLAYRQWLIMPIFAAVFLIPFYFPIVLLIAVAGKKRKGVSRGLIAIALIALLYVFVISAAYFVPDVQFELDKYHSEKLIQELIRNEIWMRTPAELIYWIALAILFWKSGTVAEKKESAA